MSTFRPETNSNSGDIGSLLVPTNGKTKVTRQSVNASMKQPATDPSVLRPSISVAMTGMKQAIKALENGSMEVRSYLLHECNVIYECRTCFNMFRSLANFIAHKRSFCQHRLQNVRHVYRRDPDEIELSDTVPPEQVDPTTVFVQPEPVETVIPEKEWNVNDYSPSLELLKEAGFINEIENKPLIEQLKPSESSCQKKHSLDNIVQRLREKQIYGPECEYYRAKETMHLVNLEPIKQTSQAVFQTYGDTSNGTAGSNYVDLIRLRQKPPVFVGPKGKIIDPGPPPEYLSPLTFKAKDPILSSFECTLCKKPFSCLKNVKRHLIRTHKKSKDEANRLKEKSKLKALAETKTKEDLGNIKFAETTKRWCKGCGKSFIESSSFTVHEINCRRPPVVYLERLTVPNQEIKERKSDNNEEENCSSKKVVHFTKESIISVEDKDENQDGDQNDVADDTSLKMSSNEDKDSGIGNGNVSDEYNGDDDVVENSSRTKSNKLVASIIGSGPSLLIKPSLSTNSSSVVKRRFNFVEDNRNYLKRRKIHTQGEGAEDMTDRKDDGKKCDNDQNIDAKVLTLQNTESGANSKVDTSKVSKEGGQFKSSIKSATLNAEKSTNKAKSPISTLNNSFRHPSSTNNVISEEKSKSVLGTLPQREVWEVKKSLPSLSPPTTRKSKRN